MIVIIDAQLKWPEILLMSSTTSQKSALREVFARFGLPQHLVSDSGAQCISEEFKQFIISNGVRHHCTTQPTIAMLRDWFRLSSKLFMLAIRRVFP